MTAGRLTRISRHVIKRHGHPATAFRPGMAAANDGGSIA